MMNISSEKLSELMSENDEIISDVNELIKEIKNYKKVDKDTFDVYKKKYQELLNDVEEVLKDIEACQRENDPQLTSFDSDKKSTRQKALKTKKLLEENFLKFEKNFKKNFDNSTSKNLKDPEKIITKNNDVNSSENFDKEESKSQNIIDNGNGKIETIKNESKGKNKKSKSKSMDENIDKISEGPLTTKDFYEKSEKSEKEIISKKNLEKSKRKGILKSSFRTKQEILINSNGKFIDEKIIQDESFKDFNNKKVISSNDDKKFDLHTETLDNEDIKNKDSILNKDENLTESPKIRIKKKENIKKLKKSYKKNKTNLKLSSSPKDSVDQIKQNELEKPSFDENHTNEKTLKIIENNDDTDSDFENKTEIREKMNMSDANLLKNSEVTSPSNNNLSKVEKEDSKNLLSDNFEKNENIFFVIGKCYVSNGMYSANEEDDLSLAKGEEVLLLDIMEDDWFYVKNGSGLTGYVPKSYLKEIEINKYQDKDEVIDEKVNSVTTVDNFQSSSLLNEEIDSWIKIKESMQQEDINKLLKACGNLPSGFRFSTICNWSHDDSINSSLFAYCSPKLSDSHLSFCDLQDSKIHPQAVKIQRQIQIVKVFQLPIINNNFIVKSRYVRLCLFNGNKIVSNTHLIRASINEKDMRTWNFVSKINESSKSLECGEIFLRFNQSTTEVSLLMEFCILGFKTKMDPINNNSEKNIYENFSDDELIEFSIGWSSIPLYENNGQSINAKKSDFLINGGTPFEKGIDVDPTIYTFDKGKSKTFSNQNKQPHVTLRIYLPNKDNKELLEALPTMIIGCTLDLVALSFYRRILAEAISDSRRDLTSSKSIYSPFLIAFTQILEFSDILDITRMIWNEKLRNIKDINKKDNAKMNELFQKIFLDYIYPLTKLEILTINNLARPDLEQIRYNKILEIVQKIKLDSSSILLNEEYSYIPLTFSELNFNIMSKYEKRK